MDAYALAGFVNSITSFSVGFFVYLKGKKPIHRYWLLMNTCVAAWALLVAIEILIYDPKLHLYLDRIEAAFSVCIPVFFLQSTMYLLSTPPPQKQLFYLRLAYLGTIGLFFIIPTPLFIKGVTAQPIWDGRLYDVAGPLYFLFPSLYAVLVIYAIKLLIEGIRTSEKTRRAQLTLFLSGTALGFILGATCFPLVFNFQIVPVGFLFVWLYTIFITYAVFRHQLWDIQVAIRRSLVYSLLITLLTAGYFGLVYAIERIFQTTFGYHSVWLSLAAFAIMALAFQPLKIYIQRLVDWLIFRVPQEELVRRMERLEQETRQTEKLKAVATLAAGLSHELKNPLQFIQTYAEFLPERYDDPEFRAKCSEGMRTEIARITDLLNQLMEFAKPKSPALRSVEPHKILDSTLDLMNNEFAKRDVDLEKRYGANGVQIQADPDQLRQVILNLVLNALDAIGQKGRVTVTTSQEDGWFTFEVADTGSGIDPKILPRLFEPFNTNKPTGTGLGLSLVHSIIREHRGEISAWSQPGQGTRFTVKLPME